jgi:hypothetical protein
MDGLELQGRTIAGLDTSQVKKPPVKREQDSGPTVAPERSGPTSNRAEELERGLSLDERDLLHEIFRALRVIRYGSVLLAVHDGHVVEIQKTERVRKGSATAKRP